MAIDDGASADLADNAIGSMKAVEVSFSTPAAPWEREQGEEGVSAIGVKGKSAWTVEGGHDQKMESTARG